MRALASFAARLWWYVRQVSGDADYENYLRAARRHTACCGSVSGSGRGVSAPAAPLSREAFYLERLDKKYSTINRCC